MQALDPATAQIVGVGRLANYIRRKLEADGKLRWLGVQGEVSNYRPQPSGAVYFDLKDRDAVLACVAWATEAAMMPALANGDEVIAYGEVTSYEKRSVYQLHVLRVELSGVGALHRRYEELKRRLQAEGLFDLARKRPLPRYPFRVALVGSPQGEGTRDFMTQARERAPHVVISLFAASVQGPNAPGEIAAAIDRAGRENVDLIVVARGGGSFEDLFAFSDERVIRALARASKPTVSAIGHEADQPLSDLVADHRAATPSAAAQTVLPRRADLAREVAQHLAALVRTQRRRLERARAALERVEHRSPLAAPQRLLASRRQRLDEARSALAVCLERRIARSRRRLADQERTLSLRSPVARLASRRATLAALGPRLAAHAVRIVPVRRRVVAEAERRLQAAFRAGLERRARRLEVTAQRFTSHDPEIVLQRGYAIVSDEHGRPLRDAAAAPPGTRIHARLARGELVARVEPEGTDGGKQIGLF